MTDKPETQEKQEHPLTILQQQLEAPRMADQLRMALPQHMPVEKFQRVLITAVSKNADLLGADRQSLFTSCVEAASDGLLPNGKEAALVIYNSKVKEHGQPDRWIKKVQYMPMIAGLYKKARNSGDLAMLDAHVVHMRDHFDYALGLDPRCEHRPYLQGDRGEVACVYAVAKLTDGTPYVEVMSVQEVEYTRSKSKNPTSGPWKDWWGEMARKTAVHRLAKKLPLSADLEKLIDNVEKMYDFRAVAGEPQTDRPKLGDFSEPRAPTIENEPAVYPLANENGEIVEEISNGSGPWCEAFIHHVKNAKTLKAIEALEEGNAGTIDLIAQDSEQNAKAARHWIAQQRDNIRAELDRKKEDRKTRAGKGEPEEPTPAQAPAPETKQEEKQPYKLTDHTGDNTSIIEGVELLMKTMAAAVKNTPPEHLSDLFASNIELLNFLSEEGHDSTVEWFEKACEPQQEAQAAPEGDSATTEPDGRPAPPEDDGVDKEDALRTEDEQQVVQPPAEPAYTPPVVNLTKKASGGNNWSAYNTAFGRAVAACPPEHFEAFKEVNKDTIALCLKESANWHKGLMRALEDKDGAG